MAFSANWLLLSDSLAQNTNASTPEKLFSILNIKNIYDWEKPDSLQRHVSFYPEKPEHFEIKNYHYFIEISFTIDNYMYPEFTADSADFALYNQTFIFSDTGFVVGITPQNQIAVHTDTIEIAQFNIASWLADMAVPIHNGISLSQCQRTLFSPEKHMLVIQSIEFSLAADKVENFQIHRLKAYLLLKH